MSLLVNIAKKYEGVPAIKYRNPNEGNNLNGFDCSGFVQWVLNESGIAIPFVPGSDRILRHSEEFFDHLGYAIHEPGRNPGDLVFFSRNGFRPSHLGIYIGDGEFIHSPGNDGKKIGTRSIEDFCEKNPVRFKPEKGFPQIYFENPIGYKRVALPSEGRFQQIQ